MNFKILATLFVCISILSFGQSKLLFRKIDSLVETKNPRIFNGVILISKNGKSKYSKSYGYSNNQDKIPLSMNTQFEIMSNSKLVTAVLILKEVEKGNINLNVPIKRYLPELTQTWSDTVTVHNLLNHTHGIVDTEKPLLFKPGTQFKYGNLSNILLGKILEGINKKSYSEQANDLFKTLGMKNTFCYSENDKKNLAFGYMNKENNLSLVEKSFINNENMSADGVISTANDLAIWDNKLHNGKILKPKTYKLLTTPSILSEHDTFGEKNTVMVMQLELSMKMESITLVTQVWAMVFLQ